ncbi:Far7p TDEL_0C01340 [Torulaspora delbrueckii]|uniref:Uncharacterized protein n=1 Tax=Torulaspora delbrueckii TaxID=4950 RepID=G8ZR81_TORDE|nr:hypothetical protein TDEL_0C01340 [Torulaspora delbrueckii]CCE91023.1 hypothetical protein TDEL_0C01340 [Torulaspora delbrueckii]
MSNAMSGNDRTHGQQQQPLYMSPQTENLSQMYVLVDRLVRQLQANRKEKEQVLRKVDVLSKQLNKQSPAEEGKNDAVLFDRFLSQRVALSQKDINETANDSDTVKILQRQNEQLRKVLGAKTNLNKETMDVLRVHEDALEQVVALLRDDVANSHQSFVNRVRSKLNDELIPLEDKEFSLYLDNINDVEQLIQVSEIYRSVLRLSDSADNTHLRNSPN